MGNWRSPAAGMDWLAEMGEARYHGSNHIHRNGWYHTTSPGTIILTFPSMPSGCISRSQGGKEVGRPTEKLVKERDRIVEEYRKLIKTDDDREAFEQSLAVARTVFPYVEDHLFYIEHWFHSYSGGRCARSGGSCKRKVL